VVDLDHGADDARNCALKGGTEDGARRRRPVRARFLNARRSPAPPAAYRAEAMPPLPRRDWKPPTRRRVLALRDRLRLVYGRPSAPPHGDPLGELVLTVLSQSTNDRNRDVAFLRLRERFPAWEAVRDAPVEEVEAAIRPGGISKVKSARIQAILRALDGVGGTVSLDDLADMSVEDARAELCALPGVGRKTAACVLLFSFGMPDVPVDTHVSRVGTRLGLFRPGAPFAELHDDMLALTPRGEELEFHVNLLRHGRRTCHAQRPQCPVCPLRRMCPWARAAR
jgi:endonuclease-3